MEGRTFRRLWERFSFHFKLPALILAVLLASTLLYTWCGYHTTIDLLLESVDERLDLCTEALDALLPKDYHDRAVTPDAIPPEEFAHYQREITRIGKRAGLSLYVLARIDGVFHVTASNDHPYFAPYRDDNPNLLMTEADGQTCISDGVDSYGRSRSIVRRLVSPGGRDYFVGADIPLREINALKRKGRARFACVGAISFFLAGVLGLVVVRTIVRPLKRLSDFIEETRRLGFSHETPLDADLLPVSTDATDEVRVLAKNFVGIREELLRYLHSLEDTVAAKKRAESEMRIAGDIQQNLLVRIPPKSATFSVWGSMVPAKSVGGDFYDYFPLDARRLAFAVGDVSGNGIPAAMFMAASLTLFRAYAQSANRDTDPEHFAADALRCINEGLAASHNDSVRFLTALVGVLDGATGRVALANGGHHPPLWIHSDGRIEFLPLPATGLVGVGLDLAFETTIISLEPGDTLLLYTDGVIETKAADGSFFGEERLLDVVSAAESQAPQALVETVVDAVHAFGDNLNLADDLTVMAVRWVGRDGTYFRDLRSGPGMLENKTIHHLKGPL